MVVLREAEDVGVCALTMILKFHDLKKIELRSPQKKQDEAYISLSV